MNTYYFSICDVLFRMDAEIPFRNCCERDLFTANSDKPDVTVSLAAVQEVAAPEGTVCKSHREHPTWRFGTVITRCGWDLFRPQMHFRTDYDLRRPGHLDCQIRRDDWIWATDSKYLWTGLMVNQILLHHRALLLHASYVLFESNAMLFIGPSGMGKSTQARLWQTYRDARIVNGDKAGIGLAGTPRAYGVPFSGTSGICSNDSAPLKAIIVLSQAKDNTIRRMGPSEAIAAICPNVFVDQAVSEEWCIALDLILELVEWVPVYALACTPDERAVTTLEQALANDSRKENRR